MMNEDEKLIPELKEWRKLNGPQFNIDNWTEIEGNIKFAIGYSNLFWPDFIEYNNYIFLKSNFSIDTFKHWEKLGHAENFAQIESIMNQIHIIDLFAIAIPKQTFIQKIFNKYPKILPERKNISKDQVVFLGNKLLEMYRAKLSIDFPDKMFNISFETIDNSENIEDYQLTFFQLDNESRKTKYGS